MIRRTTFFLVLALAAPSRADVPPAPDSPDAHCSLEAQCKAGVFCPYTFQLGAKAASGKVPEGEACRSNAAAKGLEPRCRKGGIYSGDELFCPKGATGTWAPPAPTPLTAPTAMPKAPPPSPPASAPPPTTTSPSPDRDKAKSSCAAPAGEAPGPGAAQLVGAVALALASRRRGSGHRGRD